MPAPSLLETTLHDLRFGARALRRNPGFAAIAILTLALGIGANAAIFSVVNAVLLRPLPWSEPDRAIMIWSKWTAFDKTWVATGEVVDYRRRATTLAEVAAWCDGQVNLTGDGDPERVAAGGVTANLFSTLGVAPLLGRTFSAAEDVPNGPRLVVLGHALWSRRYAADPNIVGRTIQINGQAYEVTGVMPDDFVLPTDYQNPEPSQLWLPQQMDPASMDHGSHGLFAAARLKPGATVQQAADELHGIARAMTDEGLYPRQMQFDTVTVSLTDEVVGSVRRAIWLLFGAVAFLLLIACANVANLLLARAEGRQREIAVRAALGASGLRIVRQLLTESLVLTGAAAALGLALAFAGVRFVAWWNPASVPRVAAVRLDLMVLLFTAIVAVITSVALQPRAGVARAARRSDRLAQGRRAGRVERRCAPALPQRPRGRRDGARGGAARRRRPDAAEPLVAPAGQPRLRSVAGADDAAVAAGGRLSDAGTGRGLLFAADRRRAQPAGRFECRRRPRPAARLDDRRLRPSHRGLHPDPWNRRQGRLADRDPGYLESIGERVVRGRPITADDKSETHAGRADQRGDGAALLERPRPDRRPLQDRRRRADRPWVTVVGIVGNVRHNGITETIKEKFYVPHTQWHKSVGNAIRSMTLVVKTQGDPRALAGPVRQSIRTLDPNLPVADVRTMDDVVAATLSAPRFTGMLLGGFAALALALSAIGIYGVLSYVVSRRTREIGIRLAIGAGRGQVLRLVLGSGVGLSLVGIVIGLAAAASLSRLMSTLLHDVEPGDPATFAAVAATLTAVAIAASLVPAWRATRVDPVRALKAE